MRVINFIRKIFSKRNVATHNTTKEDGSFYVRGTKVQKLTHENIERDLRKVFMKHHF